MQVTCTDFGKVLLPGNEAPQNVKSFNFISDNIKVSFLDFGCIIHKLAVKDKSGKFDDIAMGFETAQEYIDKHMYYGTVVGRVANRIADGKFSLNGTSYQLEKNNNGKAALHGGKIGWGRKIWETAGLADGSQDSDSHAHAHSLEFKYVSADGEEGYPGQVTAHVKYTIVDTNLPVLKILYTATNNDPAKDTIINLTNHSYFNLSGCSLENYDGHLDNHKIYSDCPSYLPLKSENMCPTGEIRPVAGTAFDLSKGVTLNKENLAKPTGGNGYDHNFCVSKEKYNRKDLVKIMEAEHLLNGRKMQVWSTAPGAQLYTCNFFNGHVGKNGIIHNKQGAFAIETQDWPDSVNFAGSFPSSTIYKAGESYRHETEFRF